MKTTSLLLPFGLTLAVSSAALGQGIQTQPDWLIDPAPFKARVSEDQARHELVLENGLSRRVLRLAPNAATIDYRSLVTGEQLLRATGPEAAVTINGQEYAIGGLEGQPVKNYLKAEWIDALRAIPNSYQFAEWREEPVTARFPWKKRQEWLSRDLPWPAPGRHVVLRFTRPAQPPRELAGKMPVEDRSAARADLPEIDVHYTIYDGIPLIEKWLTIRNTSGQPVRINRTVVETLRVQENESATEPNINWELPSLYVETDYARSKGIVIGAYSLLASRGAATADDNCGGEGCRIRYGVMPCLGSAWGQEYLAQLQSFLTHTGFGILEHDGSYPGGGVAATIEPLCEHLDHYEARLADLFGAGVQACYRGPRIYDTDDTKALVKKWISFYKQHREVLDAEIIHLRRPDGRDWDGILHVNPRGKEKGLAFFYNPLPETIEREIRLPLYYTGLSETARVSVEGAAPTSVQLDRTETAALKVKIPARRRTWLVIRGPLDKAE